MGMLLDKHQHAKGLLQMDNVMSLYYLIIWLLWGILEWITTIIELRGERGIC